MTCEQPGCIAPSCRPGAPTWRAKDPSTTPAFLEDVKAYMQLMGTRDFGKAAAKVFKLAMRGADRECILR